MMPTRATYAPGLFGRPAPVFAERHEILSPLEPAGLWSRAWLGLHNDAVTGGFGRDVAVSVRWLRSPAVLMTAYVGLFLYAGPWVGPVGSAHRNWVQALVTVCLAYLACRGRRAARVLMIVYSMLGVLIMLFGSTSSWQPDPAAVRLGPFACYLAQVCLLVSAPMYERTRPSWSSGSAPVEPVPACSAGLDRPGELGCRLDRYPAADL